MTEQRVWFRLTPGTEHKVTVQARIKGVYGAIAECAFTTSNPPVLGAPQNIKAVPFPLIKWILVGWNPILLDENGVTRRDIHHYKIERRGWANGSTVTESSPAYSEMSRSLVGFFIDTGWYGATKTGPREWDKPWDIKENWT